MKGQTNVYYKMVAESSLFQNELSESILLQHEFLFCSKDIHSSFKIFLVYGVIYFRITNANIL
jgi:hypothetical protein